LPVNKKDCLLTVFFLCEFVFLLLAG